MGVGTYGIGPQQTLTVQDADGSPLVTGVIKMKFTNGSVTDDGGGVVSINTSAGDITGSGTSNTIAKFTGTSAVGNSAVTDDGTTFAINTNKFTVTEASGNTLVAGTVTLSSLTSGRVPYAGTAGLLSDDSGFTYNSGTHALTATTFIGALTGNASTASAVAVGGITGLGTGVATALAVNVGSAGAPVLFNGAGGTPSSMTGTNISGTAAGLTAGAVTGFTAGAGVLTGPASAGVAVTLGNNETITGIKTLSPTARSSGSAAYLTINVPADTGISTATESIGENHVTGTRTWVDGTVALQRERFWAGPTYNKTTTIATFTDVFNAYFTPPVAGTGVTFTRGHTLGIVDSTSASSSITGGFVVATTLGTTATSVGIGGGNVNAGGNGTFGGTLSVTGHTTFEGVTSTGATGSGKLVYDTSPTIATPIINSAAHVGGTWVADATWTLPAHTLGGTVSGGGNQLNNVIIGTSTPLAGSFTTIAGTTSVYVGTGSASGGTFKLEADPGISAVTRLRLGGNGTATHLAFNLGLDTGVGTLNFEEGATGNVRLSITQAGLVSIPAITSDATHTDSSVCQDTTTHTLYSGSGAAGICLGTSSERFKNSIDDIKEGLAEVLKLRPRNFRYNEGIVDSGARLQYGLVAEEVNEVIPNVVAKGEKGEINSVDYGALWPIFVKAFQDMNQQFDAKVELLNTRLNVLLEANG